MWDSAECPIDQSAEQFAVIWQAREMAVLNEKTDLMLLAVLAPSLATCPSCGEWCVVKLLEWCGGVLRRNEWITINAPRHELTQSMRAILFQA